MAEDEDKESDRSIQLRIARELRTIRELLGKALYAISEAESEIPEKLRRFMNYTHDIHAMKYMYEELGHAAPSWVLRELERVDDRYRQIMTEMKSEGGVINKVIREMAKDPENRWDHTKLLGKPKETKDEARPSDDVSGGIDEG
jgi:hypothetical protein